MAQWRAVLTITTDDPGVSADDVANAMDAAVAAMRNWAVADWWVDVDELERMDVES